MPTILHADMDAFYAAVEQLDDPSLRGRPVVVGGLGNRGVVSTASYEARPYGVRSAMPMVEARRRCPHAVFLPGRRDRYVELSRRIRDVFRSFTPDVEPLSLDEAFLDVTASIRLFGPAREIGASLRARVREETGLAVSVGIGPAKMVAKIASDLAKPDGLLEVPPEGVERFLDPLPVERLWGAGPVAQERLRALGIRTLGDLARADRSSLSRALGAQGEAFQDLARGRDPRRVESHLPRKSISEENTFAEDVEDGDTVRNAILAHAEAVAKRLRAEGSRGRTVFLKYTPSGRGRQGRYVSKTKSRTLPAATDDGRQIRDVAIDLWTSLSPSPRIRLVGVGASNLESAPAQASLFQDADAARRRELNRAVDHLTERFGASAIRRGQGEAEKASPTSQLIEDRPRRP